MEAVTEKRILVQSVKGGGGISVEEVKKCYCRMDFHMVNLKDDEPHLFYLPSLLKLVVPTTMVALDNFIHLFGSRLPSIEASDDFKRLQSHSTESHQKFFLGGSCLGLNMDQFAWGPAPISIKNRGFPRCTILFGKMYDFGYPYVDPEVFDPSIGQWKPLAPPPQQATGGRVSCYALPDPSNNRILVHLTDSRFTSPSLYAFSPADHSPDDVDGTDSSRGSWEILSPDFPDWTHVAVVVDDVIYFQSFEYPSVIRAYDIVSEKYLKVHWSSRFEDNIDMNNASMEFDALFHLGEGIFCLALWSPVRSYDDTTPSYTNLFFPKFRAKRRGENIKLVPISSHSYVLPDTGEVRNFLLI